MELVASEVNRYQVLQKITWKSFFNIQITVIFGLMNWHSKNLGYTKKEDILRRQVLFFSDKRDGW